MDIEFKSRVAEWSTITYCTIAVTQFEGHEYGGVGSWRGFLIPVNEIR